MMDVATAHMFLSGGNGSREKNPMKTSSSSSKYLLLTALMWSFAVTAAKAFRWPNDWAESHWMINYQFGIVKRGLPGALLAPLFRVVDPLVYGQSVIRIVAGVWFLALVCTVLYICFRIIRNDHFSITSILISFVFITSPVVVIFAHYNGYYDVLIVCIAALAGLFLLHDRVLLSAVTLSVGILVHETIFMVGYPSILFMVLLLQSKKASFTRWQSLVAAAVKRYWPIFVIPLLVFGALSVFQSLLLDSTELREKWVTELARYSFIENGKHVGVANALTTSFYGYLKDQIKMFIPRLTDISFVIRFGGSVLLVLVVAWRKIKRHPRRLFLMVCLLFITILPLTMHAVAWDMYRIWGYPLVAALLALWGISEIEVCREPADQAEPLWPVIMASMVIVGQIFLPAPIMSGAVERFPNIERVLLYLPAGVIVLVIAARFSAARNK